MFGGALQYLIKCILEAYQWLNLEFLRKLNLSDTYMRIWFRLADILSVAFFISKGLEEGPQLVDFHISLPVGYVESEPFFFSDMDTFKDRLNNTMVKPGYAPTHPLKTLVDTSPSGEDKGKAHKVYQSNKAWNQMSPQVRPMILDKNDHRVLML